MYINKLLVTANTGSALGKRNDLIMNLLNHKPKKVNCHITPHVIIYMMNTISPISLYIKLDKLQSLKKTLHV